MSRNINTTQQYIPNGFRLIPNEWTPTTHGIPRSILTTRAYNLDSFGAPSAFGAVYQIVGTDFIIKIMKLRDRSDEKIFDNEVGVGSTPGIGEVGPRIYAYRKTPSQMIYIMNNVITQANLASGHKLLTLFDYYNNVLGRACPARGHPIYKALSHTLVRFYTLTQGWHGDLHDQNILVIVDRNNNVLSTKIIDYGAHQKFTRGVPACLKDIFARTTVEFNRKSNQEQILIPRFGRTKQPVEGQPYRINQNVLKMRLGPNFVKRLTNTNNNQRRPPAQPVTRPQPPAQPVTRPQPPAQIMMQQIPVAIPHQPMLKKVLNKINTKLLMNMGARGLALVKNIGTKGIVATRTLIKNELNRRKKISENKERKKIENRILFEAEQAKIANKIIAEETAKFYKREKEAEERRIQKQIELNKIMQNELNKKKKNEQNVRKKLNLYPFTRKNEQTARENPFAKKHYLKLKPIRFRT